MRKPRTYDPASPLGRVIADLQTLRKGAGLTRSKVARARRLHALHVVRREARRLNRHHVEVAFRLVAVAAASLKDPEHRRFLVNAYALANTPPGRNLSDRRTRMGLSESRVREREDEAIEELARWLMEMTDPVTLFGDYLAPNIYLPSPDWTAGRLVEAVGPDEIHPLGEALWEQLEATVILNEHGFATRTEKRGLLRALVDGITGYTDFYLNRGSPEPPALRVVEGGKAGKRQPDPVVGDTTAFNINFLEPLPLHRTLRVHWVKELSQPPPDATPENGWAHVVDVPTRKLTLRAQFDERRLPIRPLHYEPI